MGGLKQIKALGITLGIILAVAGLVLLLFPNAVIHIIATIIGAVVTAYGAFRTIAAVVGRNEASQPVVRIACAGILLVCGLYILFNPRITVSFISVIIGLFAVVFALDRFSMAKERKKAGLPIGSTTGFGFIHLVFGIVMIGMPFFGTSALVMLAGLYLLAAGAMVIASACYFFDF